MSLSQYREVLKQSTVVNSGADAEMVKRVGKRISSAVESYLAKEGHADRVKGYNWEFNLIQEDVANAWAMPGGKVAIYTGILPITKDENGLAVVMGHEVAHAIARHGNERMSQGLLQQLGGLGLAIALRDKPQQTQAFFMNAYGVGSQVGALLPFSRKHETEADEMGLTFMAMAGYDPRVAPSFWQRMSAGGGQPPEFMSTHPSHQTRVANLNKMMPEAMKYYTGKPASNSSGSSTKSSTNAKSGGTSNKVRPSGSSTKNSSPTPSKNGRVAVPGKKKD